MSLLIRARKCILFSISIPISQPPLYKSPIPISLSLNPNPLQPPAKNNPYVNNCGLG